MQIVWQMKLMCYLMKLMLSSQKLIGKDQTPHLRCLCFFRSDLLLSRAKEVEENLNVIAAEQNINVDRLVELVR